MSTALHLPMLPGVSSSSAPWQANQKTGKEKSAAWPEAPLPAPVPLVSVAFYRSHTEKMLRRYLYASMQVGRSPSILGDSVGRGWCSSRPVRTFEDAVIFVLDMEMCLDHLGSLDRQMLCLIV